jgi:hypothetical protein
VLPEIYIAAVVAVKLPSIVATPDMIPTPALAVDAMPLISDTPANRIL